MTTDEPSLRESGTSPSDDADQLRPSPPDDADEPRPTHDASASIPDVDRDAPGRELERALVDFYAD
ncbi:hypothetical protein [Halorussus salinisoli]|uniref:hypothetical protein n=1 Tax=Halorussus salinisoli TaxID=2558242 RepID=UPI0010C1F846|nr:hypothetical protein [Halorussus salinisoli]